MVIGMPLRGRRNGVVDQDAPVSGRAAGLRPDGRDFSLDALRALAILEVILAHADLPHWLFQVRNFGVPLLMLLSGWSIGLSAERTQRSYGVYLWKRFERLVIPAWAFIVVYYAVVFAKALILHDSFRHKPLSMAQSFFFVGGIGYLWVIRVNLLISCVTPFILLATRSVVSNAVFISTCVVAMVANTLIWLLYSRWLSDLIYDPVDLVIESTVFYLVGYGAIFAIGTRASRLSRNYMLTIAAAFGISFALDVFVRYSWFGVFEQTQLYKFPPQIYYLSYAMCISFILLAFRNIIAFVLSHPYVRPIVGFVGSNTLWIYLWHILALDIIVVLKAKELLYDHFLVWWAITAAIAIALTWSQKQIIRPIVAYAPSRLKRPLTLLSSG